MDKKTVTALILTLLLTSMLTMAFNVQPAKSDYAWSETIYIQADGSIQPPTAPISSLDNVTYTLTDNITGNIPESSSAIIIQRDNITIDGTGYTLQGTGAWGSRGIELAGISNVTIKSMKITAFHHGIYLDSSSDSSVSGNNITANTAFGICLSSCSNNSISGNAVANNRDGICLSYSSNNSVSGNNITANTYNGIQLWSSDNNSVSGNTIANNGASIWLGFSSSINSVSGNLFVNNGLVVDGCYGNVVTDNLVNGKPLVYLEEMSDVLVGDAAGQVVLVKCNNITVKNLNLCNTTIGIELWATSNTTISGNNITANSWYGIWLHSSSNNSVGGNTVANNREGIVLYVSSNISVSGNNITANGWQGIEIFSSSDNSVSGNTVANNGQGIYLGFSSSNRIYHNNFINNTSQVSSYASTNVWDSGDSSGGNYWSDYNGTDANADGIGDAPYEIDANNIDNYPLMIPFGSIFGDVDGDGSVGRDDILMVASHFGREPGEPDYARTYDFNGDGYIGVDDIFIAAIRFGGQEEP